MNKGFLHKHADEKTPEPVKFEISFKPMEKVCIPDDRDCNKNYNKHIGKKIDKNRGKDYGKEYEKDLRQECDKDHEKDCEKDYDIICDKNHDTNYGKDCEKDCANEYIKEREKDYEKDREKDCGKDCDKEADCDKKNNFSICADYYCISKEITVKSCDDLVCFNLGEIYFKQNGFILELSLKLKDVCPKRHTALAVVLYELDKCEKECLRGFKTVLLPPTGKCDCSDICVNCLRFVIPQALDKNDDFNSCGPRKFVVRFIANYADSDFNACGCEYKS